MNHTLTRDAAGQLCYTDSTGKSHSNLNVVRAYPISAPDDGVSLVGNDGHELAWFANLNELPKELRELLSAELAVREFMPKISRILAVSSYATPSTWSVTTDRGDTELILKTEDHIRRLTQSKLLIVDSQGISFLIDDVDQLDKHSRKFLDRFL